jgi:arginine decarboxylase
MGQVPGNWGDKLYLVMAEQRTETPGEEAWAGIGWVQEEGTNRGLFVEHEGSSEIYVRDAINESLKGLMATRGVDFGEIKMSVVGTRCEDDPVCALVLAVYESQGWKS